MKLIDFLVDLLFPPRCFACGSLLPRGLFAEGLCPRCRAEVLWINDGCPCCGFPREECRCLEAGLGTAPYDGVCALGRYEGRWRTALHRFKFYGEAAAARPLGYLMGCRVRQMPWGGAINLVVPIPLHPLRLRERGYNQSLLLAREIARNISVPCRQLVRRERNTAVQAGLGRAARQQNVKGAFQLAGEVPSGVCVLLVDDIMTTGATVGEVSLLLKKGGASAVYVAVAAR